MDHTHQLSWAQGVPEQVPVYKSTVVHMDIQDQGLGRQGGLWNPRLDDHQPPRTSMSTSPCPYPSILTPLLIPILHVMKAAWQFIQTHRGSPFPPFFPQPRQLPHSPPHQIAESYEPDLHYEVSDLSVCQGERFKTELYGRGKRFLPN